jgi:hypothetical protein
MDKEKWRELFFKLGAIGNSEENNKEVIELLEEARLLLAQKKDEEALKVLNVAERLSKR